MSLPSFPVDDEILEILIVEDDADTRDLLRYALRGESVQVTEASSGREALDAVRSRPVDIALVDLGLPDMPGLQLLSEMRRAAPDLYVLVVSGQATQEDRLQGFAAGADDFVAKPFSAKELAARVHAALRHRRIGPDELLPVPWESGTAGEQDLQGIAEAVPHIVWVARPDGSVEYVNQLGAAYTGRPAEELLDGGLLALAHPDDRDRTAANWTATSQTVAMRSFECRLRRADGEYLWHLWRALPVHDAAGAVSSWLGTAIEIEEQKRAEGNLSDSQRTTAEALTLLETLQDAAPVAFGFLDPQFRVVRINQELAAVNGAPPHEQIGRTLEELVPELWGQVEAACRHVLESGASVRSIPVGGTVEADRGRTHEWLVSLYPVRVDVELLGIGVIAVDVTARMDLEALRSAAMTSVAEGVCALDADGRLTYMNRAASKMLGWTEEELRGRDLLELIHVEDPAGADLLAADDETVGPRPEQFRKRDGTIFSVSVSTVPLRVRSNDDSAVLVFADLSDPSSSADLIRVIVADGHPGTSHAFQALLHRREGVEVVFVATTTAATVSAAARLDPDVVLIADDLPGFELGTTVKALKSGATETSVILITDGHDDETATAALAAGCAGLLDRSRAWVDLISSVRAAYRGEATISQTELRRVISSVRDERHSGRPDDLTPREQEVLACMRDGLANRLIAQRLGVTTNTVRNHVQRILFKLNVHSKLEAIAVARTDEHPP